MLMSSLLPVLVALAALLVSVRVTSRERDRAGFRQSLPSHRYDVHFLRGLNPWVAPIALFSLGFLISSPALAVTGPMACLGLRNVRRKRADRRSRAQDDLELLGVIDETGHGLRSGNALASAFLLACAMPTRRAPSVTQFSSIADSVRAGARLDMSLKQMLEGDLLDNENELSDNLRLVGVAMSVMIEFGGPAAAGVDRLSQTLRASHAATLNQRAQASQATASASLLAGLPLVFGLVLAIADDRIARFYAFSVGGAACVIGSLGLASFGWLWMDRMIWR